jgi:hypothetical protein
MEQAVLDVLRVVVVLHPLLLNLIDESPRDGRAHVVRQGRYPAKLVKQLPTPRTGNSPHNGDLQ